MVAHEIEIHCLRHQNDYYQKVDSKNHKFVVGKNDFPDFGQSIVHQVCSTYVLAREIEWSTRLFVIDMIESDEEGIGTSLHIEHLAPAFEGEEVEISARVKSMIENHLICDFKVRVNDRLVAKGTTGQKILKKERLSEIFTNF